AALDHLAGLIEEVLAAEDAPLSLDDRSEALRIRRELAETRGDPAAARRFAELQRALLDRAAKDAPTVHAEMTYAWPRAEVYHYLGELPQLVEWLESLVTRLPAEYDPPY